MTTGLHVPFTSLATNARCKPPVKLPPAPQLPADAHDTGYRFKDWQLWLTDDKATAYMRTSQGVEAWPESKDFVGCR